MEKEKKGREGKKDDRKEETITEFLAKRDVLHLYRLFYVHHCVFPYFHASYNVLAVLYLGDHKNNLESREVQ